MFPLHRISPPPAVWMDATIRCHVGLGQVPITFGEFNVSDVRPAQLFNILVDIEGQLKWDESMSEATGVF